MQSSSQKQIYIQQVQKDEASSKELEEQMASNLMSSNQQQIHKQEAPTKSLLLSNQQKGTSLASVTQISKLLDDYGQYLNLQTSKLKSTQQSSKNNLQLPIKRVFENMISPLTNQHSAIQSNLNQTSLQNNHRKKFRSNSNHQPSQNYQFRQDVGHKNRSNNFDLEMINRINANKIYQIFANQNANEANGSFTNLEQNNLADMNMIQQLSNNRIDTINNENKQITNVSKLPVINSPRVKHCYLSPKSKLKSLTKRDYNKQISQNYDNDQDSSQSLKIIKREQPNTTRNQQNTIAYKRKIKLQDDLFIEQEDTTKMSNSSPANSPKQHFKDNSNQQGYSNLLKQNTKVCQQFIVPKIKFKSYSSKKNSNNQQENSDENSKDEINSFQQSLANQQDPSNFNFINLCGNNSIFNSQAIPSPRKQAEEYLDSYIIKQNRDRSSKSRTSQSKQNSQTTRFLPQINSPTNFQNGDGQSMTINGCQNNQSSLIEEQIKQSKEIYGKKYFKNLKIESLIKEYEKRSIKSIFDMQIPVSSKKNKQEIYSALEEKKQKEQKLVSQNPQNKSGKSDILKNNKEHEQKLLQNIQGQLSKSALTNKLELDLKYFRERTKSSLIRGQCEMLQQEFKVDSQSVVQGYAIQQQNTIQNQLSKNIKNNAFSDYGISQFGNQNYNLKNNQQSLNAYIKRGSNSLDIATNQQIYNPNQDFSILTHKSTKQAQQVQETNNSEQYKEEKDILDNFLKSIKKKQVKTIEYQSSQQQSPLKSDHRQCLIINPIQPETLVDQDQEKLEIQIQEGLKKDLNSQKICAIMPSSTKSKYKNKNKKWNFNQKTVGQENVNENSNEINNNGGWETKTNSNFDQLYSLF
ncbi:hypothetical protein TTHERM_00317370 (macronuclear) [Tetrahymena thermophila SB210]|uniref:Uncharacterized protein n=1 Tax=Tetrahymena thermophila (strain SB210) TaxID=312017 RepID=I7MG74_TETTS|nr:hypothetical protein TTHERM_00317370 [Tetrahymena thermophila SB210]EAS01173.1 hypothetical protein TTHERM_00317370 [Tetrahymena thermophila SB210]|eukprot:XP_001021418.1 hypothetical protein TTHERM_00317370 [Tetrahymena thermophila SB210]